MKAALVQFTSAADPQDNLRRIAELTARAAQEGAGLVVFPEATMMPFGTNLWKAAEDLDGAWVTELERIATEAGVVVVAGMFRPGTDDRVINTLVVRGVGPGGERIAAHYDKIHLYDAFGHRESEGVTPGEAVRTVRIGDLTIGLAICYDVRFPALFTAQARAGAQAIIVSASWGAGPGKVEQWELLNRARALDSTAYVLACGQADPRVTGVPAKEGSPTGVGHSLIAGPDGGQLARAGAGEEIITVQIDPERVEQVRGSIPVLANSRLEGEVTVEAL